MTDIYKAPEAQLTENPNLEGYGSLERGQQGLFKFSINDIINEAWEKTKGNKGKVWLAMLLYMLVLIPVTIVAPLLVGAMGFETELVQGETPGPSVFIGIMLTQIISMVVTLPVGAGFFMVGLKIASNLPVSATEVVSYFNKTLQLLITTILMYIMIALGFLLFILPGFYLMISYYLAIPLVVEKGLGPWAALEASRKAVTKCWFRFFGLGLVMMVIMMLGMIPLGIGLIWVLPLMLIAFGIAYRNIFGVEAAGAAEA